MFLLKFHSYHAVQDSMRSPLPKYSVNDSTTGLEREGSGTSILTQEKDGQ